MRRLTDSLRFWQVLDWLDTHLPASPWLWEWEAVQTCPWLRCLLGVLVVVWIVASLLSGLLWLCPDALRPQEAW